MEPSWIVVAAAGERTGAPTLRPRRLYAGVVAVALLLILGISALDVQAARGLSESTPRPART